MSRLEKRLEQLEAKKGHNAWVMVFGPDFPEGHKPEDPKAFFEDFAYQLYGHKNYDVLVFLGQKSNNLKIDFIPDVSAFFAHISATSGRVGVKKSESQIAKQRDELADFLEMHMRSEESKKRRNS